jgi:hypothetical protein
MPLVDSSAISFIHYDEVAAELHVLFTTGKAYVYYGVPRRIYGEMLRAPSLGAFFNRCIRDKYRYRQTHSPLDRNYPGSSPRPAR